MSYLVLARKWRPLTFDQMVGQRFVSRTLRNAVETGRVAHAFLFTGSRGVGKTSAARILAKCLNCDQGPSPEPCNRCTSCVEITEGRSLDVYEIDGASNTSVDDVRELRENIKYLPRAGKRRIYIIDEVHMLSRSAFNALLKTLEEPPDHVLFIFATTEPQKVPETIQSRCQRFDFRRISAAEIHQRLREIAEKEGLEVSEASLSCIVKAADGSMRDAQSLLDQVISYCGPAIEDAAVTEILGMAGQELFFRVSGAVLRQDAAGCLEALDELYRKGYDVSQFYRDLTEHFRNLLIARVLPDPSGVLEASAAQIEELRKQAGGASMEDLQRLLTLLLRAEGDVLRSEFPRMGLEMTLIRMAGVARLEPLERILERLDALGGPGPAAGPGPGKPPAGGPGRSRAERTPGPAAASPGEGRAAATVPPREPAAQPVQARPGRAKAPSPGQAAPPGAGREDSRQAPPPPRADRDAPGALQAFMEAVRRERSGLGVLLEDVIRWEVRENRIRAYCEENSFVYQKLRQPDVQDLLSRVAGECFSGSTVFQPCVLRPEQGKEDAPGGGGASGPAPSEAGQTGGTAGLEVRDHPAVQQTLELFRGEITEVKPPQRKGP